MMQRFFSTTARRLRVPPGAPAHVKEIPIPRTARTTAEIRKHIEPTELDQSASTKLNSKLLSSIFPDLKNDLNLSEPVGVWYNVQRSRSGNLPVYTDFNNAGGVWTEVRKVQGNVGALRNDLKKALDLTKQEIWVKPAAQTIVIKGNRCSEVKELLSTAF